MDLLDELNDDTWLENLETNIEMYDDLYSEVVETVSVFHIYIDKNDDISNIKRESKKYFWISIRRRTTNACYWESFNVRS